MPSLSEDLSRRTLSPEDFLGSAGFSVDSASGVVSMGSEWPSLPSELCFQGVCAQPVVLVPPAEWPMWVTVMWGCPEPFALRFTAAFWLTTVLPEGMLEEDVVAASSH